MLVFLLQFLNFGRAKFQVLARWVVNPTSLLLIMTSLPLVKRKNSLDTRGTVQSFSPPIVEISLSKQVLNVKDVYELPFKVTVENKLRSFQFKIMHNMHHTNQSLSL